MLFLVQVGKMKTSYLINPHLLPKLSTWDLEFKITNSVSRSKLFKARQNRVTFFLIEGLPVPYD